MDITLAEMVKLSNNSRMTQELTEKLNKELSPASKRLMKQWLVRCVKK